MNFYKEFEGSSRKPSLFSYFFLVFLGAILGSVITITALSNYWQTQEALPLELTPPQEENTDSEREGLVLPENQNTAVIQAAKDVAPAVVGISNRRMVYDYWRGNQQMREVGTGSGVIIDSAGIILTNFHVIEDATEVMVILEEGEEVQAEIIGADPATDLAVLKIDREGLPAAAFGDSGNLQVGEMAIAIGNPLGLAFQQSVTLGVISATDRIIQAAEYRFSFIQTDAAINPGNSGGPLVNLAGKVIGINTAKINLPGFEGMGFAIPSNMVRTIVAELIEHGRINRPWMGINIDEITPSKAAELGLPVDYGVLVVRVVSGSPAQRDGILIDDIIIGVAGRDVRNFEDLRNILFDHRAGDTVEVRFIRHGVEKTVEVALKEMPEDIE